MNTRVARRANPVLLVPGRTDAVAPDDSKALRLPKDTNLINYEAGQSRDLSRDFAFCNGKTFALIRLEDPFVTKTEWNYNQLKRFLEAIFPLMSKRPTKFVVRTKHDEDGAQKLMLHDMDKWLKSKGTALSFELVPAFGPGKRDFHDRRLLFVPDESNLKNQIKVLMTGGIDRYLDPKFECSIVVQI